MRGRYGRDGVQGSDPEALALVKAIDAGNTFAFAGVYTHGGHSYDARGSVLSVHLRGCLRTWLSAQWVRPMCVPSWRTCEGARGVGCPHSIV